MKVDGRAFALNVAAERTPSDGVLIKSYFAAILAVSGVIFAAVASSELRWMRSLRAQVIVATFAPNPTYYAPKTFV